MIHSPPGETPVPGEAYLAPTAFFDYEHPAIRAFVASAVGSEATPIGKAVKLFYAVRDRIRYDPFNIGQSADYYVASNIVTASGAFCIPKGILLTAAARAVGIPTAIGMADVVNHLTTEKLRTRMGGSTHFIYHGYAYMHLDGRWVKAAPAFNIELCTRFDVLPTDFDGRTDAIYQPYDALNRRHMEYVKEHGVWSDFPYQKVIDAFKAFYPPSVFADEPSGERFEEGVRVE